MVRLDRKCEECVGVDEKGMVLDALASPCRRAGYQLLTFIAQNYYKF